MTITLVGSSRELRRRNFLPPIDLLDLLASSGSAAAPETQTKRTACDESLPQRKSGYGVRKGEGHTTKGRSPSPRSIDTGEGFAADMDPFMALLRTRQHAPFQGDATCVAAGETAAMAAAALAAEDAAIAVVPTAPGKKLVKQVPVASFGTTPGGPGKAGADALPPSPPQHPTSRPDHTADAVPNVAVKPYQQALDAVGGSKKRLDHHELQDGTDAKGGGGGGGGVGDAHRAPHTARAPAQSRPSPTPCYPRGVSAGVGGVSRRRKSRTRSTGIPLSSGHVEDSLLRLCPALEARISDLRRDNTAAARFLNKAQATAWQKRRRPVGALVSRNRALCALEGAEWSLLRREELAMRARRKRDANAERKRCLERRRLKEAEAVRIKHEGASKAELQALEQAVLLEKRQRFFLTAIVALNSAVRWRNDWKERKWELAKIGEAFVSTPSEEEAKAKDMYETSVERVQRFVRRRQGEASGRASGSGGGGGKPNVIRCLKMWIPSAHARWKGRRRAGGIIIYDFLKDARLSQNLKAIYRFRRKVMRCQAYVRGVSVVTRGRLALLGLYFSRCEKRLRERLADRVRQQVHDEAAADLEVHRQLMRPSVATADTTAAAATTAATGRRWESTQKFNGRGSSRSGGGDDDGVSELMETVAALRLKSALEELETRSAHPDVKKRLLEGLLVKVRAAHQSKLELLSGGGEGKAGRRGIGKGGRGGTSGGSRRGVSLPEAFFTVDDARELFARPQPLAGVSATPSEGGTTGGGGGGEVTGASNVQPAALPPDGGRDRRNSCSSGGDSGGDLPTHTKVSPLLLLRSVPEAVMCQLVLAGWEQGGSVGGGAKGH